MIVPRRVLFIAIAVAALASVVAASAAGGYLYLRRSLPQLDGSVSVPGLSQPVEIVRDEDAVTHVLAVTKLDALYGLGYAHAQDRLWQMEFGRRIALGRLSEVMGAGEAATDRFFRALGLGSAARSAWDSLSEPPRTEVNAYVAGINAFIAAHHGSRLPIEFTRFGFEPEPWTGVDVLASGKMLAWDMSRSYATDALRHDIAARVGASKAADLFPSAPPLPSGPATGAWMDAFTAVSRRAFAPIRGGSAWVVDGTRTASGMPLLTADAHVEPQVPSRWYLAHLSAGNFDVIGATVPGIPAVLMGQNRSIAWSATASTRHGPLMSDAMDMTIPALMKVNDARNWTEFTDALRAPIAAAMDFVYADRDGHIGARASGSAQVFDPPGHVLVSATNSYSAKRIEQLLAAHPRLDVDAAAAMQTDVKSLHAEQLVPLLFAHAFPETEQDDRALSAIKHWSFDADGDSPAAAIFHAWYHELLPAVAGDELGPALVAGYQDPDLGSYRSQFLAQTLSTADNPWCDNVTTTKTETCDEVVMAALRAGLARLTSAHGPAMKTWRWEAVHTAVFAHAALDGVPLLGWRLRRTARSGGDWSTINTGPVSPQKPFEQQVVGGYRQVVDLSTPGRSVFLDAVGQSAHVLSARYADALLVWSRGSMLGMRVDPVEIRRGAIGTLHLRPGPVAHAPSADR